MFLPFGEQRGDSYELQYCLKNITSQNMFKDFEFCREDSLFIDSDEVELFDDFYLKYFQNPVSPDGSFTFSPYGPNYYDKKRMEEILTEVRKDAPPEGKAFIYWLEHAPANCNGFYFLGI